MTDEVASVQAPAPQPPESPRLWGAWATIGLGLAIGFVFIAAQTLALLGFLIVKLASGPIPNLMDYLQGLTTNGLLVAVATVASAVAGIALIYVFIRVRGNKNPWEYLGLNRIGWKTVLAVAGVFILTLGATLILEHLAGSSTESVNSSFMTDTYKTAGWLPFFWLAVAGFAPAFEEAFFRGFLFAGLVRSKMGVWGTVVFTSIIWASLHLQYNWAGMAEILLMGFVLGFLRYKTRSLWSTFIFHSAWNLVALIGTAAAIH
jgi:membrane protease YdiL (CAAX protease family)